MKVGTLLIAIALWSFGVTAGLAQATSAGGTQRRTQFEVVSVRLNPDATAAPTSEVTPGRFKALGQPVRELIERAFAVEQSRIVAPEWTRRDRFDIEATFPRDTNQVQFREMLQTMLEDRFSMKAKREVRSMEVLALIRARSDGRLGPQLKSIQRDCSKPNLDCAVRQGIGSLTMTGRTWEQIRLASFLASHVGMIVVDRTGLLGQFDLTLQWQYNIGAEAAANSDRPGSISSAIVEQLGLKLQKTRSEAEVLVVDQISMPSRN